MRAALWVCAHGCARAALCARAAYGSVHTRVRELPMGLYTRVCESCSGCESCLWICAHTCANVALWVCARMCESCPMGLCTRVCESCLMGLCTHMCESCPMDLCTHTCKSCPMGLCTCVCESCLLGRDTHGQELPHTGTRGCKSCSWAVTCRGSSVQAHTWTGASTSMGTKVQELLSLCGHVCLFVCVCVRAAWWTEMCKCVKAVLHSWARE